MTATATAAQWDLIAIKKSIPAHLYKSNTKLSLYYACRSFVFVVAFMGLYSLALSHVSNPALRFCISLAYWFFQGTVFWGIFTIGHDCGHRSFSPYQWLNDLVGTLVHGFILVPYYPWKMSHQHHHKNTGNMDTDEIFYPIREKDAERLTTRALASFKKYFFFGAGWPAYLLVGYPGSNYTRNYRKDLTPEKDGEAFHSHFNPLDPMWANNLFLSFTSISYTLFVLATLIFLSNTLEGGFTTVLQFYFVPWFVFSTYLVVVTFLHHASEHTRWLAPSEWNYTRGQLENTVDRDYGALVNNLSHNIGTHVVHHLFPIIPHYNLVEANKYLKKHTKENGLPHHEIVDRVSGLGEFFANSRRYAENFIAPNNALTHSICGSEEKKTANSNSSNNNKNSTKSDKAVVKSIAN